MQPQQRQGKRRGSARHGRSLVAGISTLDHSNLGLLEKALVVHRLEPAKKIQAPKRLRRLATMGVHLEFRLGFDGSGSSSPVVRSGTILRVVGERVCGTIE